MNMDSIVYLIKLLAACLVLLAIISIISQL